MDTTIKEDINLSEASLETLEELMSSLMQQSAENKQKRMAVQKELDRRSAKQSIADKFSTLSESEIEYLEAEVVKNRKIENLES